MPSSGPEEGLVLQRPNVHCAQDHYHFKAIVIDHWFKTVAKEFDPFQQAVQDLRNLQKEKPSF